MPERPAPDPKERVSALLAYWQATDDTPVLPPTHTQYGEAPTQALFRNRDEEDANLPDEEREQDETFWEELQKSINADRTIAGMRALF